MFSAVHPTTDIAKILRHVRFVPQADIARAVCSHITRPPTEAASLVERQNNFRGGYLDRSNVTILRVSPLSAQFGITRHNGAAVGCRCSNFVSVTEKQSLMQNLQPPFQTT